MTTRVVPFSERHRSHSAAPEPAVERDAAAEIVAPDGRPARRKKTAKCPQCGAGADQRVTSGMGPVPHVTCEQCGHEVEKEGVS